LRVEKKQKGILSSTYTGIKKEPSWKKKWTCHAEGKERADFFLLEKKFSPGRRKSTMVMEKNPFTGRKKNPFFLQKEREEWGRGPTSRKGKRFSAKSSICSKRENGGSPWEKGRGHKLRETKETFPSGKKGKKRKRISKYFQKKKGKGEER